MAKKKDLLKKQLGIGTSKPTLKKEVLDTESIENITETVYSKNPPEEKKEAVQRTTLDIPKSIHLAAKMEAMKRGMSLKDFIISLIKNELEQ